MTESEHAERFTHLRPLLFTIVYEILGSATESDDVLQDSYLRWAQVELSTVRDTKSYLAQLVTREALKEHELIVCHPENVDGGSEQLRAIIAGEIVEPRIAQYASSIQGMLSMVAAGFGVSFIAQSQIARNPRPDVRYLPIDLCEAVFCVSALYRSGGLRPEDRLFFESVRQFLGMETESDFPVNMACDAE